MESWITIHEISKYLSKPDKKFVADIIYGMLASGSCLLTDVVDQLHEPFKKINIVDRLSRHLDKGIPALSAASYLPFVMDRGYDDNKMFFETG